MTYWRATKIAYGRLSEICPNCPHYALEAGPILGVKYHRRNRNQSEDDKKYGKSFSKLEKQIDTCSITFEVLHIDIPGHLFSVNKSVRYLLDVIDCELEVSLLASL